jgi:hypothetical protein
VDLRQACETILSRLDVHAEAEALGVEFAAASPSPSGWLPCRAVGRVDRNPRPRSTSAPRACAASTATSAIRGGRAIGFFDLAVRIGRFPDRESAVRHYAEQTGVGIPPAGNGGPHGARSLEDRVVRIPARPSDPADLEAWCRRKSGLHPAALRCRAKSVKKKCARFLLGSLGRGAWKPQKVAREGLAKTEAVWFARVYV